MLTNKKDTFSNNKSAIYRHSLSLVTTTYIKIVKNKILFKLGFLQTKCQQTGLQKGSHIAKHQVLVKLISLEDTAKINSRHCN